MDPKVYDAMRKLGLNNRHDVGKARKIVKTFRENMGEIKDGLVMVAAEAIKKAGPIILMEKELVLLNKLHQLDRVEPEALSRYLHARQACIQSGIDPSNLPEIPDTIRRMLSAGTEPVTLMIASSN